MKHPARKAYQRERVDFTTHHLARTTAPSRPGLTPRQGLDHLSKIQMIDVHLPTTDGRELLLRRRTEPNAEQSLLLTQLKLLPIPHATR